MNSLIERDPMVIETPIQDGGGLMPFDHTRVMTHNGIITAQRVAMPRSEQAVLGKLRALAQALGDDFYYSIPVSSKNGTKSNIEGTSIKGAMAVARLYGNCQVNCDVQETPTSWIFNARFVDFETGFSLERPYQQRKGQSSMKTDKGRQEDIAFQIGASKAIRNVVCNALDFFCDYVFQQAKQSIVEKVGKNLERYREKVLIRLEEMNIEVKNVEAIYGKPSREWVAQDIAKMIAELQSIQDGMATAHDVFPAPKAIEQSPEQAVAAEPAKAEEKPEAPEEPKSEAPAAKEEPKEKPAKAKPKAEAKANAEALQQWADSLEPLLQELAKCKTEAAIDDVLAENDKLIDDMSQNAPAEVVKAYAGKLAGFRAKIGGKLV